MAWYDPTSWFGGDDYYDDIEEQFAMMEQMLNDIYGPYMEHGMSAYPGLSEQYNLLMTNPAAVQNMLGAGYTQSPGYQFQMDQAMNAANQSAAAGGMLGTNAHEQQAMGYATGLASQDYNTWMANQMRLYGMGLQGNQGFYDTGYNASNQYAGGMGNLYANQANLISSQAQSEKQMFSDLLGAAMVAGGMIAAPATGGASLALSGMGAGQLGGANPQMPAYQPYNYSQAGWIV